MLAYRMLRRNEALPQVVFNAATNKNFRNSSNHSKEDLSYLSSLFKKEYSNLKRQIFIFVIRYLKINLININMSATHFYLSSRFLRNVILANCLSYRSTLRVISIIVMLICNLLHYYFILPRGWCAVLVCVMSMHSGNPGGYHPQNILDGLKIFLGLQVSSSSVTRW